MIQFTHENRHFFLYHWYCKSLYNDSSNREDLVVQKNVRSLTIEADRRYEVIEKQSFYSDDSLCKTVISHAMDSISYHQMRGGAMRSLLTLTMASCYMFFFEREIVKPVHYIDDIFVPINWPSRHLLKRIEQSNQFDKNILVSGTVSLKVDFLDLQ
jgi:hypothetical protein